MTDGPKTARSGRPKTRRSGGPKTGRCGTRRACVTAQRGFTLVELVVTIVIVAIAGVTMTQALSSLLGRQSNDLIEARASALANAYLEEIAARRYDENAPAGGVPPCSAATTACSLAAAFDDGESRAAFDDVDDYDGLDEQPPLDATGAARDGYDAFRVQISVRYATAAEVAGFGLDAATDFKLVTVNVVTQDGVVRPYATVRSNY